MVSPPGKGGYDANLFRELAGTERSFWYRARNRLIVQLVRALPATGDRFLEVGCGSGEVLRALARDAGLRVTGGELFPEGLELARHRVPEAELVQLDAREMPFEEEFDFVGAFDVIEHIDDDLGVLRGMYGALRPGGHLIVTVPQHRWLWSEADELAKHVRRYRRGELVKTVRDAGFETLRTTSFVSFLLPLMVLSRWGRRLSRKPYDPAVELVPPEPVNRALERVLDLERALIARGVNLPAGGSLVLVARRPVA